MGANEGIHGVGIGLGQEPKPSAVELFNGTGGTAVVYHEISDYQNLMALKGKTLPGWSVDYPPVAPADASAVMTAFGNNSPAGVTSVTFSEVRILDVEHVDGYLEVTMEYGAAHSQASRTGVINN